MHTHHHTGNTLMFYLPCHLANCFAFVLFSLPTPPPLSLRLPICLSVDNEETEGSEGQAEYVFGDAELDDDDLYSMEHDNQTGES